MKNTNPNSASPPRLTTVLWRGLRSKCPRCGGASQYRKWFTLHKHCPQCELVLEPASGDTWGFWIVGDRVFVAALLVLLYLGVLPRSWPGRLFVLGIWIAAIVITMPLRQGVCTALDYFLRVKQGQET
ncbi:MAG: hypothetical protein MI923_10870 [Phycisphaerales bacterium]|nr:hypothetical protein [Phycisphaerales bacterium]